MRKLSIYQNKITFRRILAFTIPTILMTLIQTSYSMIDGMFISNILGEEALSALTFISPYFNLFMAIAAMFASGGSAIVMKKMGEGKSHEACSDFTALILISSLIGFILSTIFVIFTKPFVSIFGTTISVAGFCGEYLFAYSFFIIPQLLFSVLQIYTIASEGSLLAMFSSLFGGAVNIIFDFLMIKVWNMGMTGAAVSSGLGMLIPCIILGCNFLTKKKMLHFTYPRFRFKVLAKTITNGSSEFSSNLVSGIVILLFNARMLSIAGENGVAASTITFYVFELMSALYMGYMFGISPLLSYFYGSKDSKNLQKIRKISLTFISIIAVVTTIMTIAGSSLIVSAFTRESSAAFSLAVDGNKLFALALLLVGFNTFFSMLFTALSNGKTSAIIVFSRTFVFLVASILLLPLFIGINGLWLSVPASEALALILSVYFFKKYQTQYNY